MASTNILKFAVQRPRPFEAGLDRRLIDEPFGNSFPSGHSTQAMTIVTAVAVVYPNVAAPLYCLGLAIALSRIYLGVHFPFDVLLGVALGRSARPRRGRLRQLHRLLRWSSRAWTWGHTVESPSASSRRRRA